MRKVRDGEEKKKKNTSLAAPGALAHRLQLSPKRFFDPSTPSMRKGDDRGEKNRGKKGGMVKIVATNVVAS